MNRNFTWYSIIIIIMILYYLRSQIEQLDMKPPIADKKPKKVKRKEDDDEDEEEDEVVGEEEDEDEDVDDDEDEDEDFFTFYFFPNVFVDFRLRRNWAST